MRTRDALRNAGVRLQGKTAGRRAYGLQFQMGALIIGERSFPLLLGGLRPRLGMCFVMLAGEMPVLFAVVSLWLFFLLHC